MAGCGGNCTCRSDRIISDGRGTVSEGFVPRDAVTLAEALAKVIIDNKIVRWAVDYSRKFPEATADDIVAAANDAKLLGEL